MRKLYITIFVLALLSCRETKRREITLMDDSLPFQPQPVSETLTGVLDSGEYLSSLITRVAASRMKTGEISLIFGRLFKTEQCRPGESLFVFVEKDSVVCFLFKRKEDQMYRVFRTDSGWRGETVEVDVSFVPFVIKGKLDAQNPSLWQSIINAGGNDDVAAAFCNLLEYQADFTFSSREGDSFEILIFKKYSGGSCIGRTSIISGNYWGSRTSGEAYLYPYSRFSHFSLDGQSSQRRFLSSPVSYSRISSGFSPARFHPILQYTRAHRGVDYSAPTGTPVSAIAAGTVVLSGWSGEAGIAVRIKHSGGVESEYYHLSKIADGISMGKRIEQGQLVGFVGSTGLSTGPHLHFGIKINGTHVDPLPVLARASGEPLPENEMYVFEKAVRYYDIISTVVSDLSFIEMEKTAAGFPGF